MFKIPRKVPSFAPSTQQVVAQQVVAQNSSSSIATNLTNVGVSPTTSKTSQASTVTNSTFAPKLKLPPSMPSKKKTLGTRSVLPLPPPILSRKRKSEALSDNDDFVETTKSSSTLVPEPYSTSILRTVNLPVSAAVGASAAAGTSAGAAGAGAAARVACRTKISIQMIETEMQAMANHLEAATVTHTKLVQLLQDFSNGPSDRVCHHDQ